MEWPVVDGCCPHQVACMVQTAADLTMGRTVALSWLLCLSQVTTCKCYCLKYRLFCIMYNLFSSKVNVQYKLQNTMVM